VASGDLWIDHFAMATTNVAGSEFGNQARGTTVAHGEHAFMRYVALLGRVLFSAIFVMTVMGHFSQQAISYAATAGVPLAGVLVPLSGIIATVGGLSILLGYRAKIGAWLLVLFLVPVTPTMHAFWAVHDPMMAQMQQGMFMKNLSMLGGALLIAYFGAGPLSLDAKSTR
jgi:putative oxidoreductase